MKYGYNDNSWKEELYRGSKVCTETINFNMKAFIPFMQRKTLTETDMKAIEALAEMVEMMKAHAEEIKK